MATIGNARLSGDFAVSRPLAFSDRFFASRVGGALHNFDPTFSALAIRGNYRQRATTQIAYSRPL